MIPLAVRRLRAHPRLQDAGTAVLYLLIGLLLRWAVPEVAITWWPGAEGLAWPVSVAVLTVACLGETVRRSHPLVGLAVGVVAFGAGPVLGTTDLGVALVFADLLYCAVLHTSRRASRLVCGAAAVAVLGVAGLSLVTGDGRAALLGLLNAGLLLAVPVMWAAEVRRHRVQADTERANAAQARRMAELDRSAAVAAERTRMARDLHDVVAGQLSAIALQSAGALNLPDADQQTLRRVLRSVREQSVASLTEMRTMIQLLRADADPDAVTAPPGLDRLDGLLGAARASGLRVELSDERTPGPAGPAAVELAAHRIVAESLTNAAKHAPGSSVRVALRGDAHHLVVEVSSDLPDRPAAPGAVGGTGAGLPGLRERAAAVGGTLVAGPQGDSWRVLAELPRAEPALGRRR